MNIEKIYNMNNTSITPIVVFSNILNIRFVIT